MSTAKLYNYLHQLLQSNPLGTYRHCWHKSMMKKSCRNYTFELLYYQSQTTYPSDILHPI
jgi:hypothetical protein